MLTGLKAFGNTTKTHPAWAVIIIAVISVLFVGVILRIGSFLRLNVPGVNKLPNLGAGGTGV